MKIKNINAREILDSRGNPTVETELELENGIIVKSSVPSGASTGENEALELRDNDKDRYHGKGVLTAVNNVNNIIKKSLIGMDINQEKIDDLLINLDGTNTKSKLGANAILSVSLCVMKALAKTNNQDLFEYLGNDFSLPYPMMNIINGGAHANSGLEIQEFMIIPMQKSFKDRLRCGSEIFQTLKNTLKQDGYSTSVGDEGGFAPKLGNIEKALDYIVEAIKKSNYIPGENVFLALDCAASEFYDGNNYNINNKKLTKEELIEYYILLINKYPIISIEDAFAENDINSIKILTSKIGDKIMLVGDDYFVTNIEYLEKGIKEKYNNAILLKANQIGTITEMLKTIDLAKKNNFKTIISHRSGETEDTFIADLAVGLNLGYIKTGSVCRGERICKYNQLLRIEEKLNDKKQ
ncbi:MAG: phosphopyruvate hydratase [Bacilli bacterium]|nr:phosphopyruvate hydratase [Bacilli bacterium]MDD3895747.1 phosphopyruvate hydratase [Bacilli bacterium]MDD4407594.1 phosphopyruvate hydratase [Bacilli bacterium]